MYVESVSMHIQILVQQAKGANMNVETLSERIDSVKKMWCRMIISK